MRTILKMSIAVGAVVAANASADIVPDRATLDGILGGSAVTEDFESYSVGFGGADSLDVASLDAFTIANGQGPGLVQPGATYWDPSATQLQWNGDTYFGMETKTLLSNGSTGQIFISYDAPVLAAGLDLRGFAGYPWTGTVDVYGVGDALLGSIPVAISSGGAENVFAGWEDAGGIIRMEISSGTYSWSPIIDNHTYGVPAPSALGVLGMFGLAATRRRR